MAASQSQRALIAVATNVLFDLADEVEDVADAVQLIRRRLHEPELLIPPTVREELADHLRSMDFARLAFELQAFHARVPVIATPREIVRKFFA